MSKVACFTVFFGPTALIKGVKVHPLNQGGTGCQRNLLHIVNLQSRSDSGVLETASAIDVRIDNVGSILKFRIWNSLLERTLLGSASPCGFRGRCSISVSGPYRQSKINCCDLFADAVCDAQSDSLSRLPCADPIFPWFYRQVSSQKTFHGVGSIAKHYGVVIHYLVVFLVQLGPLGCRMQTEGVVLSERACFCLSTFCDTPASKTLPRTSVATETLTRRLPRILPRSASFKEPSKKRVVKTVSECCSASISHVGLPTR